MNREELILIGNLISKKYLLPKQHLDITSRQINYWKERDILPFFEKEKKGFMGIPQALWVLIINELSNVGVDTVRLQKLSYDVWLKPFYEKYADSVFEKNIAENKLDKLDIEFLVHSLGFEPIMITKFRKEINYFTDALKSCLISNRSIVSFIYCPKTGEHSFNLSNVGLTADLNNLYFGETLIVIPFLPLLSKLIGIEIEKSNLDLEYLSSVENQIRRVLFFDKPKLLEIVLPESGKPKIYKITEEHKKAEELAKFFLTNKLPLGSKIMIETRAQDNYKITITT
ncbi:MAG: hypothetical protein RIQ59_249 [Bacteroidota bacterium]|jgi:hypothetical protein